MYKKYRIVYKMYANDHKNALPLCIEWENMQEIEAKRKEILKEFQEYPIEAKDTHGNPMHWFGDIPYSVSIIE